MTSLGGFANKSLNKMASASGERTAGSSSSSETQQTTGTNSKDDDSQGIKAGDGMPLSQVRQGQKGTMDSSF